MVKTMFRGSTIEIWSKDYINREPWMVIETKDIGAEILQIEHAYDDYFMVEVRRVKVDDIVKTKRVLVEEDLSDEILNEKIHKDPEKYIKQFGTIEEWSKERNRKIF